MGEWPIIVYLIVAFLNFGFPSFLLSLLLPVSAFFSFLANELWIGYAKFAALSINKFTWIFIFNLLSHQSPKEKRGDFGPSQAGKQRFIKQLHLMAWYFFFSFPSSLSFLKGITSLLLCLPFVPSFPLHLLGIIPVWNSFLVFLLLLLLSLLALFSYYIFLARGRIQGWVWLLTELALKLPN